MRELTTQISHEELIDSWAPICDVSRTLDCLKEKLGDGFSSELFGVMDRKVKLAEQTLAKCLHRLEKENPDQFS